MDTLKLQDKCTILIRFAPPYITCVRVASREHVDAIGKCVVCNLRHLDHIGISLFNKGVCNSALKNVGLGFLRFRR